MFNLPIGFQRNSRPVNPLLLDLFPGAKFAYSMKRLRAAYNGLAVSVVRPSDGGVIYLTYQGNNDVGLSSYSAFIGAETGLVSGWYSQQTEAGGSTSFQSTQANMPVFVPSSTPLGSKPAVQFGGTSVLLSASNFNYSGALGFTFFAKVNPTANTKGQIFYLPNGANDSDGRAGVTWTDGNTYDGSTGQLALITKRANADTLTGTKGGSGLALNTGFTFSAMIDYRNAAASITINTTEVRSTSIGTTGVADTNASNTRVGSSTGTFYFPGQIQTLLMYPFPISLSIRQQIEALM